MSHESSFDIKSARCFLNMMIIPQFEEFRSKNSSSRHAVITMILLFHMFEWANPEKQIKNEGFLDRFRRVYPNDQELADKFDMARKIANGTKHRNNKIVTCSQAGFSSGFSDAFARPLVVIDEFGNKHSVDKLLREMVGFWQRQEELGNVQ